MKIGIFGDSYASTIRSNDTLAWNDLLPYQVDNYGLDGSSLYDAIKKIKKVKYNYDKIILVVTHPGRLYVREDSLIREFNINIAGYQTVEQSKKRLINGEFDVPANKIERALSLLNSINDFYSELKDDDYDGYIHQLMFNDLKQIKGNDLILVPGFSESFVPETKYSLFDVFQKENKAWGIDHTNMSSIKSDFRNCHLTAKNNEILAQKIIDCINGKPLDLNTDDFISPTLEDKQFYIEQQ